MVPGGYRLCQMISLCQLARCVSWLDVSVG